MCFGFSVGGEIGRCLVLGGFFSLFLLEFGVGGIGVLVFLGLFLGELLFFGRKFVGE